MVPITNECVFLQPRVNLYVAKADNGNHISSASISNIDSVVAGSKQGSF